MFRFVFLFGLCNTWRCPAGRKLSAVLLGSELCESAIYFRLAHVTSRNVQHKVKDNVGCSCKQRAHPLCSN